jgi:hypothetical protein
LWWTLGSILAKKYASKEEANWALQYEEIDSALQLYFLADISWLHLQHIF